MKKGKSSAAARWRLRGDDAKGTHRGRRRLALAGALPAWAARRQLATGAAFTHGVASGMPATRSARLWTRSTALERAGRVDARGRRATRTSRASSTAGASPSDRGRDFTVHSARSRGLRPGERYWYRFAQRATRDSPVGTLRHRAAGRARPSRCGSGSSPASATRPGWYTPHPRPRGRAGPRPRDRPRRLRLLGARRRQGRGARGHARRQQRRQRPDAAPSTATSTGSTAATATCRRCTPRAPYLHIWDDNDVENNYTGDDRGRRDGARGACRGAERRANALPRLLRVPAGRRASRGDRDADLPAACALGDRRRAPASTARQYRDDQPCNDEAAGPCPEANDAGPHDARRDARRRG